MNIYNIIRMERLNIISNTKYNVGNIQKQRINIGSRKETTFKQADIKKIVKDINEKFIKEKNKTPKILVRGMSELGVWTLKAYEDPIDDMFEDYDDYLAGRIKKPLVAFPFFNGLECSETSQAW